MVSVSVLGKWRMGSWSIACSLELLLGGMDRGGYGMVDRMHIP